MEMELYEGRLIQMSPLLQPLAVTMGNFDGVHLGHRSLIEHLKVEAQKRGLKTALLTFSPHPAECFYGKGFSYLQSKESKIAKLKELGIDFLVIQDFDRQFSELTPTDFLKDYFLPYFNPRLVAFGYDFTFGKSGKGDFNFLDNFVDRKKVEVYQDRPLILEGLKVSSSLIREKLKVGDVKFANQCLSYSYRISGEVSFGDGIGKKLGFPTANISNIKTLVPGMGVYWGWVLWNQKKHPAVLNIGVRPSINGAKKRQVEAHILDFSDNIYGQEIEFEFLGRIREEKKFEDITSLINQISLDVQTTRDLFKGLSHE